MFTTKSTIDELAMPTVTLPRDASVRDIRIAFADNPQLQGILVDTGDPDGVRLVCRSRFFEHHLQPASDDRFSDWTAEAYIAWAGEETLAVEADTPLYQAAEIALEREDDHVYDPIVVEFAAAPPRLADMRALVRAQAEILRSASRTANETLTGFLKSQEQLLQARKMEAVGTLSAGLAHELNTPLQFVGCNISFLEKLHGEYLDVFTKAETGGVPEAFVADWCEEVPGALRDIRSGLERMGEIVAAMQSFSGKEGAAFAAIDVNETIRSAVTLTQGLWKGRVDLSVELAPGPARLHGIANALTQAWVNLLTNGFQAIEATGEQHTGAVAIRTCRPDAGTLEVRISDNGVGMCADTVKRCFDPFFTTRSPGHGTGQGLTTVHKTVVIDHRGQIHVDSRPACGTTFRIVLPAG